MCDVPPMYVYVLGCPDAKPYVGSTADLDERLRRHFEGNGAAYTRRHPPDEVLAVWEVREKRIAVTALETALQAAVRSDSVLLKEFCEAPWSLREWARFRWKEELDISPAPWP